MEQLTCVDWRQADEAHIAPLYAAEQGRWSALLHWETAGNWAEVEKGRRLGNVPGIIVTNQRGMVVGWSYYFVAARVLQIGAFISSSEACTALMLEAILGGHTEAPYDAVTFFALTDAAGLIPALKQRRLSVCRYWYLARDLDSGAAAGSLPRDARQWRLEDVPAAASLLVRAYAGATDVRPFAPGGGDAEWREYVTQLVTSTGCGTFMNEASICMSAGPGRLAAVSLVSRIGADTAHLVQIAVDPQFQRRGIGGVLLDAAASAAARAGCRRITLLVAGGNTRARQLYEGARFAVRANFVAAGSVQPRRSTSVAPGGSVMTLR